MRRNVRLNKLTAVTVLAAARVEDPDHFPELPTQSSIYGFAAAAGSMVPVVATGEGCDAVRAFYSRPDRDGRHLTPTVWLERVQIARQAARSWRTPEPARSDPGEDARLARTEASAMVETCHRCHAAPGEPCISERTGLAFARGWHWDRGRRAPVAV